MALVSPRRHLLQCSLVMVQGIVQGVDSLAVGREGHVLRVLTVMEAASAASGGWLRV